MKTKLITGPTAEPVLLADAKLHLRIETAYTADDTYITALLTAARQHAEAITNRKFITQTWKAYLNAWPCDDAIKLPYGSLQSVTSVVYIDSDGTSNTLSAADYTVESDTEPGRVVLNYLETWPTDTLRPSNPIQIQFICGYGLTGATVPGPILQAIKLIISDLYEQREPFIVGRSYTPTRAVESLLASYRLWSFA